MVQDTETKVEGADTPGNLGTTVKIVYMQEDDMWLATCEKKGFSAQSGSVDALLAGARQFVGENATFEIERIEILPLNDEISEDADPDNLPEYLVWIAWDEELQIWVAVNNDVQLFSNARSLDALFVYCAYRMGELSMCEALEIPDDIKMHFTNINTR